MMASMWIKKCILHIILLEVALTIVYFYSFKSDFSVKVFSWLKHAQFLTYFFWFFLFILVKYPQFDLLSDSLLKHFLVVLCLAINLVRAPKMLVIILQAVIQSINGLGGCMLRLAWINIFLLNRFRWVHNFITGNRYFDFYSYETSHLFLIRSTLRNWGHLPHLQFKPMRQRPWHITAGRS